MSNEAEKQQIDSMPVEEKSLPPQLNVNEQKPQADSTPAEEKSSPPQLSLSELSARMFRLEEKLDSALILLTDIYRYEQLRDLLAAGKWKEADRETTNVMLELMGHSDRENLTPDDAINFPCSAIQVIDRLWLKYSKGRFGFSVQQSIYTSFGGTNDIAQIDMKILQASGDRLGWRANNKWIDYQQLDFSINAPPGCHPSGWWRSPYGAKMAVYFLARLINCKI